MGSYINDLYNGKIYSAAQIHPASEEYRDSLARLASAHKLLAAQQNLDLNNALENFLEIAFDE